jgi:hypothetical protein
LVGIVRLWTKATRLWSKSVSIIYTVHCTDKHVAMSSHELHVNGGIFKMYYTRQILPSLLNVLETLCNSFLIHNFGTVQCNIWMNITTQSKEKFKKMLQAVAL